MKRFLSVIALAVLLFACEVPEPDGPKPTPTPTPTPPTPTTVAVSSVSLSKTSITLTEGDKETLTATVLPNNATDKTVEWSSSNTSVASVSNGTVTAIKAGTTTITVKTKDGGKTATCAVTVNAKVIPVSDVTLNKTELTLTEGESETLTATVKPDNATDKTLSWSSSDATVASVDDNGKVTALKAGTATITVKTKDGGKTATCKITVVPSSLPGGHEGTGQEVWK